MAETHNTKNYFDDGWDELVIGGKLTIKPEAVIEGLILNADGSVTTLDAVPTQGSQNPVSSGGVYDALQKKADGLAYDESGKLNLKAGEQVLSSVDVAAASAGVTVAEDSEVSEALDEVFGN